MAKMSFNAWKSSVLGKYIDMDGAYGAQCWDLWAHYANRVFGAPLLSTYTAVYGRYAGLAGSLYTEFPARAGIEKYFTRLGPNVSIRRGDVLIWTGSPYPDTHVAIADESAGYDPYIVCLSQNTSGTAASAAGATIRVSLTRQGLAGILRPKNTTGLWGNKPAPKGKKQMTKTYRRRDKIARASGRSLKPGEHLYLDQAGRRQASAATNIIGGLGEYLIVVPYYLSGAPGDTVQMKLVIQANPSTKKAKNSSSYTKDVVIGEDGFARGEFVDAPNIAKAPTAVYVQLRANKKNKRNVKVTLLDSIARLN